MRTSVSHVFATHWHDDHVRGLSRLVEECANAQFCCADVLTNPDFAKFVACLGTGSVATEGAKISEFRNIFRILSVGGRSLKWTGPGRRIANIQVPPVFGCSIYSLSPSDVEKTRFLENLVAQTPQPFEAKRAAASPDPNLAATVIAMDFEHFSLLLGADMEIHHDTRRGWTAAIAEAATLALPKAELFKVPHHGSATGHHPQIWTDLLKDRPASVVTPFNKLREGSKLPTAADLERLASLSGRLYLSASRHNLRGPPKDAVVKRALAESGVQLRSLEVPVGAVRLRRRHGPSELWSAEVFEPAQELACS